MVITFTVPGKPQAKQRVQTAPLKRCMRCGTQTMRYQCKCGSYELKFIANISNTPKETVNYENLVKLCATQAMEGQQFSGAVRLRATFKMQVPPSRAKKLQEGEPHTQRPDTDNMLKSLLDGCNGVCWPDDSLVAEIVARKVWTHGTATAEVELSDFRGGEIEQTTDSPNLHWNNTDTSSGM